MVLHVHLYVLRSVHQWSFLFASLNVLIADRLRRESFTAALVASSACGFYTHSDVSIWTVITSQEKNMDLHSNSRLHTRLSRWRILGARLEWKFRPIGDRRMEPVERSMPSKELNIITVSRSRRIKSHCHEMCGTKWQVLNTRATTGAIRFHFKFWIS